MDEGFEASVDTSDMDSTSSDVANDAPIEETSDLESDIPEDVVDDAPIEETPDLESDIPEDVVDDAPIEETSDLESDIPEDVVDDALIEETSDLGSDIPEDVVDDAPIEETSDLDNGIHGDEVEEMSIGDYSDDTSEMLDDLQSEKDLNDIAENDETVSNDASGIESELVAEDELGNEIEDQIAESETGNVVEEQPVGNEKNQLEEGSDILNNVEFSENESAEDEADPNEAEATEEENEKSQLEEGSDIPNNGEFSENESVEDEAETTAEENEKNQLEKGSDILNNGEFSENESDIGNETITNTDWNEDGRGDNLFARDMPPRNDSDSKEYSSMVDALEKADVDYRPIKLAEQGRTEQDICNRLSGGDMTKGSCSSLALAYAGNKAGYDVLDFRDGDSRRIFSNRNSIQTIADMPGVNSTVLQGTNDFETANQLLSGIHDGKEYYLATGGHAAIVKSNESGYQYLELQHPSNGNGWQSLSDNTLRQRFGCRDSRPYESTSYLMEVDSLANNSEFLNLLGYINTAETSQKKGGYGNVR